ncbi:cyclic diguanylate phosphodiesterase [Vibrio anguillarum]|uniref:EAL domain-containing protein n=1 Tax=Vibrio anguillarum TaxID=55601 RepID=UPI00188D0882|nr:EAL domain-containing protein [Vibrio anguillarum]MBF4257814.1 cyclic diguanylate phosphodiesterase [Vibrio anguillarum]MBF4278935.1 cyclic diguanylate phosphodiesterase [Vibrio anguillarum]MBF4300420.1 cyclic diguanylate phosphodiesterase [Vibrio anguillarum]MBF4361858.1 cyclic diguanylate phosphodiesterase [Vibrio anguillarum]MBF4397607.1 cyclic diguanylate phosphodiesterase [Vibrio anguillarum]
MHNNDSSPSTFSIAKGILSTKVSTFAPILGIFFFVFTLAIIKNFYDTNRLATRFGEQAITQLEHHINQTSDELNQLSKNISKHCQREDIIALRSYVFRSKMVKEVGMYNAHGTIFCTSNEGHTTIHLYKHILDRLKQSPTNTTISLTKSRSKEQTFFVYASQPDMSGLNALMPPEQFMNLVAPKLAKWHYGYQVNVLSQSIRSDQEEIDSAHTSFLFKSEHYPLSIQIYLNNGSYAYHFLDNLWLVLLTASIISLIYLAYHNYYLSRNTLEVSLREAISSHQLELYLQPIVDITENRIVGSEALLRWNEPSQGYISPTIFIPLSERIGVIHQITYRVLKLVTECVEQHKHALHDQYISINISRLLIIDNYFMDYMKRYATKHPAIVPRLLLEITEDNHFNVDELKLAMENLQRLKQLGFKIAIDDFGTGYSGLNFIHQHDFHTLKIDQVFIKSLHQNSAITSVLVSMIKLAKQLNMRLIAEGVENQDQVRELELLGVRYIQGFYYSEPMSVDAFFQFTLSAKQIAHR